MTDSGGWDIYDLYLVVFVSVIILVVLLGWWNVGFTFYDFIAENSVSGELTAKLFLWVCGIIPTFALWQWTKTNLPPFNGDEDASD